MKIKFLTFAFALFIFAGSAYAQATPSPSPTPTPAPKVETANINGKWTLLADAGGQILTIAVEFKQTGDTFTGTTMAEIGGGTITGGKVTGKDIVATLNADVQGQAVIFAMVGAVDGANLSGTFSSAGFGSVPFTATKDK